MGAWGHGYFDNDEALDFIAGLEDADDPKDLMTGILEQALETDYVEVDTGAAVIVAAAYIDRQVNGTTYTEPGSEEPLEVDTFPERHPGINLANLREEVSVALMKVMEPGSELYELWQENEALFPEWKAGVQQLILRLKK